MSVIPTVQHFRLLEELHYSHFGIVKMKEVVRKYFWWPGITKDIEAIAAKCDGCKKFRKKNLDHCALGHFQDDQWSASI